MSWKVVFRKDLVELLRNRKALFMVTILPLLLFSALGVLSNYSLTKTPTVIAVTNEDQGYDGLNYGRYLITYMRAYGSGVDLVVVNETSSQVTSSLVLHGEAQLGLVIPANFTHVLNQTLSVTGVLVFMNQASTKAQVSYGIVDSALSQLQKDIVYARVRELTHTNASSLLNPINVYLIGLSTSNFFGGSSSVPYGGLLPALIVLVSVETNIGLIVDSLVGEKERKTLEMLLVAAPSRRGIIVGKMAALICVSLVSVISTLAGTLLEVGLTFSGLSSSITSSALRITAAGVGVVVLILLGTMLVTQLVTATLSAYATNTKEANAGIAIVMSLPLVSMYPLLFSSLGSLPPIAQGVMYLLPFTYSYLLLYSVLVGPLTVLDLLYALILVAYSALLFAITVKLYGRETVIVGGSGFLSGRPRLPQSSDHENQRT